MKKKKKNLDNSYDKILLPSQKDLLNKKEKNILSVLKETKIPSIQKENVLDKQTKSLNERNENKNIITLPLNTIETATFKTSIKNNYNNLLTEVRNEKSSRTLKAKKKYKFSERKNNRTNKELKIKLLESAENYYDLYNKHFNDTSSLEQKFSFKIIKI